jgi:hypothetical protein
MICEGSGERYLVSGVPAGIGLVDGLGLVGQRDMLVKPGGAESGGVYRVIHFEMEKGSGVLYRAYMPV